jgi:hypothetical protein
MSHPTLPQLVFCCGMIRSGSTVLYQLASAIVERRGLGRRCGYYEPPGAKPVPAETGWSVVKVPWLCEYERQRIGAGAMALYSYRDVEEALTSAFRAFDVAPGDRWFWRVLTEGHAREMQKFDAPTVFRIPFGAIRDHLREVVAMVSAWIPGRPLAASEIDAIAGELALDRQKARPKKYPFDPETLLYPQHFE